MGLWEPAPSLCIHPSQGHRGRPGTLCRGSAAPAAPRQDRSPSAERIQASQNWCSWLPRDLREPGISRFNVLYHLAKARNRHVCLPLWLKEGFLGLCYVADEWTPVKDGFEFSAEAETFHPGGAWSGAVKGRPWLPMSWEHFSLGWWSGVHPFTVPGRAPAPLYWAHPSSGLRPLPGRPAMILP